MKDFWAPVEGLPVRISWHSFPLPLSLLLYPYYCNLLFSSSSPNTYLIFLFILINVHFSSIFHLHVFHTSWCKWRLPNISPSPFLMLSNIHPPFFSSLSSFSFPSSFSSTVYIFLGGSLPFYHLHINWLHFNGNIDVTDLYICISSLSHFLSFTL